MKPNLSKVFAEAAVACLAPAFCSCESDSGAPEATNPLVPIELTRSEAEVSTNLSDFSLKLLSATIETGEANSNVAVSPLGAAMVAGMFGNAIDESQRGELMTAFELNNTSIDELNAFCNKMLTILPSHDNTATLMLANSSWFNTANENAVPSESYLNILKNSYESDIKYTAFDNPQFLTELNTWAGAATNGAIPQAVKKAPQANAIAYWLNVLYFKGLWKSKFDKALTKPADFTTADGAKVMVNMMTGANGIKAYRTTKYRKEAEEYKYPDDFIIHCFATMDYGNGAFALTAVMPDPETSVAEFIANPPENFWKDIVSEKYGGKAQVFFPKLNIDISTDLIKPMMALGVENIFEGVGMSNLIGFGDGVVCDFDQHVSLAVDEEGSEFKVVTSAVVGDTANVDDPIEFNRPFIYFIWEKSTGTILLAGVVMNPAE
ncbi:MAG: serpin family protein [Muribaculaceae bacterium]|nr:serpin family protein [Muribaculaceae bacterium]